MSSRSAFPFRRSSPFDRGSAGDSRPGGLSPTLARALLVGGAIAGPLYVALGAIETFTRTGYDFRRHSLSILANGDRGWIHSTMMVTTGALTVAGALGARRALPPGCGATWGPRLIGLYGAGVLAAGFFRADPALGFPPGTPPDANDVSPRGIAHFASGGVGFLGLIAACLTFARRFAAQGEWGWATYSAATGGLFFAAFVGIATGAQLDGAALTAVILAFTAAIVLGWSWITAIMLRLLAQFSRENA